MQSALALLPSPPRRSQADELRATAEEAALAAAHTRLDRALHALIPRSAPAQVGMHALSELLPIVQLSVRQLVASDLAAEIARSPGEIAS